MQKKKTAIITARMTPEDKQKIEQRAANAGMTVTDYLTTCALGKKIVRVDGLDKILTELKAQGRNLNQLTVLANMERLTVMRGDDLADGYAALCEQVHRLAREVRCWRPSQQSTASTRAAVRCGGRWTTCRRRRKLSGVMPNWW